MSAFHFCQSERRRGLDLYRAKKCIGSRSWVDLAKDAKCSRWYPVFDRFTSNAKMAMSHARQYAQRARLECIETEHILLGILALENSQGYLALHESCDLEKLHEEIEAQQGLGKGDPNLANLPFTPRSKKVLELTMEEATYLVHDYIGTEHLVAGLARDTRGIAGRVLRDLGVDIQMLRKRPATSRNRETIYYALSYSEYSSPKTNDAAQVLALREDYIRHLIYRRQAMLAGSLGDDPGSLVILTVHSRKEAEQIAADDPAVRVGVLECKVKSWHITHSVHGLF